MIYVINIISNSCTFEGEKKDGNDKTALFMQLRN